MRLNKGNGMRWPSEELPRTIVRSIIMVYDEDHGFCCILSHENPEDLLKISRLIDDSL